MPELYSKEDCLSALALYRRERDNEIPTRSGYMAWCTGKAVPSTNVVIRLLAPRARSWNRVLHVIGCTTAQARNQRRRNSSSFSRVDCVAAIARATSDLGHVPHGKEFAEWRERQADSERIPSQVTIVRLFDPRFPRQQCWKRALRKLGADVADIPEREYGAIGIPRSCDELIEVLKLCADDIADVPSSYAFDRWRKEQLESGEIDLPTQTTLRRRLGGQEKRWAEAVRAAGFDPSRMSAETRQRVQHECEQRCRDSLQEYATHFGGVPPLAMYLAWSLLDAKRASIGCILKQLTNGSRRWEDALTEAGLADAERLDRQTALERNGVLPTLASREDCIHALQCYYEERGLRPTMCSYRIWSKADARLPSVSEIILHFSAAEWNWSVALDRALASE